MDLKSKDKKTNSPKSNLKCSLCPYKTHAQQRLYNHIRTHTKERPYKCQQKNCNSAFAQKTHLLTHQLIHKKDDESLYKFKCSNCPYKTMVKQKLKQHLKTHSDFKEFFCDLCPYQSKLKGNIDAHKKRVHLKLKPFKCPQPNCNYASSRKSTLNQHQVVHKDANERESVLKFQCRECPFKTNFKGNLTQHLMVHSEVKQFECDLCPYRSKTKRLLKSHKTHVHSTLKPFKCVQPGCNFSCKQASTLTRHLKVHVDEKPLSCTFPDCTFTAKWKESLNDHERIHRGEKPFKCSLCPKDFRRMDILSNHFRCHTGETPYPCPSCPYRAKSSSSLNRHLKSCKQKTNGKTISRKRQTLVNNTSFECKIAGCDFFTEQNSSMAIHYNNIHNFPRVNLRKTEM